MWKNETVFSLDDLSDDRCDEYYDFIRHEYNGRYLERFMHVRKMIEMLQYEQRLLEVNLAFYPPVVPVVKIKMEDLKKESST